MSTLWHSEWYPDAVTPEGVAAELTRVAAELGLEIGTVEPVSSERRTEVRVVSSIPGRVDASVAVMRSSRCFRFDNNESGVRNAQGRTSDLGAIAHAVAAWCAGADPRGMQAAASFVRLPEMAEARATGSAELVVAANWRTRRDKAQSYRDLEVQAGQRVAVVLQGLLALFDAVDDEPKLRCLFGGTSHHNLWFSRCTDIPFAKIGSTIAPLPDRRFEIWPYRNGHSARDEAVVADTARAAVAYAAKLVPDDCGSAIIGTAADVPNLNHSAAQPRPSGPH
jgi:Family of unknown function (DUF6193)